ncbi:MAG: histidine phosphatase family protein [Isosphaeraceae bacterium]
MAANITRLFLIRHGATAANQAKPPLLQGRGLDQGLEPIGVEQARRVAGALSGYPIEGVYCSPLRRAKETAALVGEPRGLEAKVVPALIEVDVGRWLGLSWVEIREQFPAEYAHFHEDPGAIPYYGGESFIHVASRAVPALHELADNHPGGTIVAVAHHVVNRAVIGFLLGVPTSTARSLRQVNGGINLIEYHDGPPRVVMINSCLHLQGLH